MKNLSKRRLRNTVPAALLVVFLCGCAGSPTISPCESEPVLMIVTGETLDTARMREYAQAIAKSGLYEKVGGYYLNNPRPLEVFEGEPPSNFVTLAVRFPSLSAARAFWYSGTYQKEILPLRQDPPASNYTVAVFAESDIPDYMAERVSASEFLQAADTCGPTTTN